MSVEGIMQTTFPKLEREFTMSRKSLGEQHIFAACK